MFVLAKNEAHRLPGLLASARPHVAETVVLADVDSADDTVDTARRLASRCYPVRFADSFGDLLTLALHLCFPHSLALWLDADELLLPPAWKALLEVAGMERGAEEPAIFCIRRRRWADAAMTRRIEPDNPDWSPRLLPVSHDVVFSRRLHPAANGLPHVRPEFDGLFIEHFQDLKTPAEMRDREALYIRLAKLDGIAVEGGQPLDQACADCGGARRMHAGAWGYATPPFLNILRSVRCGGFR